MPLPKPRGGESENDFISRCMGDPNARSEFPDQDQRSGYCHTTWRDKDKNSATDDREWLSTGPVYAQTPDNVDLERGVIHGASIISKGEAKGHDFWVDDAMLDQFSELANKRYDDNRQRIGAAHFLDCQKFIHDGVPGRPINAGIRTARRDCRPGPGSRPNQSVRLRRCAGPGR